MYVFSSFVVVASSWSLFFYEVLRIDNGDLRALYPEWCVFSDRLVIHSSI